MAAGSIRNRQGLLFDTFVDVSQGRVSGNSSAPVSNCMRKSH